MGLSGGTRGLRQNSHIVFITHKGNFSVRFLSRGLRQQAQVVFAAGKRGFSVVFRARGRCQLEHVVFARASLYGHCCAGEMLGNTRTTSGRVQDVCGRGRVRSTGFGRNRVLRDRNLFILLGFEGAKCRICWIFGTSREVGRKGENWGTEEGGAQIKKLHPPGWRMQRIFIK